MQCDVTRESISPRGRSRRALCCVVICFDLFCFVLFCFVLFDVTRLSMCPFGGGGLHPCVVRCHSRIPRRRRRRRGIPLDVPASSPRQPAVNRTKRVVSRSPPKVRRRRAASTQCNVMAWHAMPCHAAYHAMSCHVMLLHEMCSCVTGSPPTSCGATQGSTRGSCGVRATLPSRRPRSACRSPTSKRQGACARANRASNRSSATLHHIIVQDSAVQYSNSTVQYRNCTVQYCTVPYSTVLYSTVIVLL